MVILTLTMLFVSLTVWSIQIYMFGVKCRLMKRVNAKILKGNNFSCIPRSYLRIYLFIQQRGRLKGKKRKKKRRQQEKKDQKRGQLFLERCLDTPPLKAVKSRTGGNIDEKRLFDMFSGKV